MAGIINSAGFSYALELIIAALLYMCFLKKRRYFPVRLALSSVAVTIAALLLTPLFGGIQWTALVGFLIIFILLILLCLCCCRIALREAVLCGAFAYLTQHFASALYLFLIYEGVVPEWGGILYWLSYGLAYAACTVLFAANIASDGHYNVSGARSAALVVLVVLVSLVLSWITKYYDTGDSPALFRACQIYAMAVCFFMLWMEMTAEHDVRTAERLRDVEAIWEKRRAQYEMSRENIDMINRKCHDLKHQIAALADMRTDSGRRDSFIREIQDMVDVYDSSVDTGSEALDTILMEKGLYCHLHHIRWNCIAQKDVLDFMDAIDLYTMMGNALDNAAEGTEKIKDESDRNISVQIWRQGGFAVMQVENSYAGDLEFREGLPVTTKGDKTDHGYGLRSIRDIAEKYRGTMTVKAEDGFFILSVVCPAEFSEAEETGI